MTSPRTYPLWPQQCPDTADATATCFTLDEPAAVCHGHVLICPGGGYGMLAEHEGPDIARWLNTHGFEATVLRYRLGTQGHHHPAMIHDAQRAMRVIRNQMRQGEIRAARVAVLGFSAGGHLASTLAVHHDQFAGSGDPLEEQVSARPDAAVLCYPVIDLLMSFTHKGSRRNLLGVEREHDETLQRLLSTHLHVTDRTPPTFLWHTADDGGVPMQNSLQFAAACRHAAVPVELHVFESGQHGLGLAVGEGREQPDVAPWAQLCIRFLRRHLGITSGAEQAASDGVIARGS